MSVPYTETNALATWAKAREIAQDEAPGWDDIKPAVVAAGADEAAARDAIGAASVALVPSLQVREAPLPVTKFGADTSGAGDSSPAFQEWLDTLLSASGEADGIMPPGDYRLASGLLLRNTKGDHKRFPNISGTGRGTTTLRADFADAPVIDIDGSSHTPYRFFRGGSLRDFTITQATGRTGVLGIRHNGWWGARVAVDILSVSSHGIHAPLRSDIHANPDGYASVTWLLDGVRVERCGGWGMLGESGVGWGVSTMNQCVISVNAGGGVKLGGHSWRISQGAIAANGGAADTGGLMIQRQVGVHPQNLVVEQVEFDGNYSWHILLEALQGGEIMSNRFVHQEATEWADGVNHPFTAVQFGHAGTTSSGVTEVRCRANKHRYATANGTPVVGYGFAHGNAGLNCEILDPKWLTDTAALTKYQGLGVHPATQAPHISEFTGVVSMGWRQARPPHRISERSAAYTFALADAGTEIGLASATPATFTIPDAATVPFPIGTTIRVRQLFGAGQVTIAAAAGATVVGSQGLKTRAAASRIELTKRTATAWVVDGDAAA